MKNLKYMIMVLIGGILYGTMSSFVKLFYSKGYNAAELSFSQALLSAFLLGALMLCYNRRKFLNLSLKHWLSLLFTGGLIGTTNFLYYQSVDYISASLAIVILMQFTWFSLLLEWVVFGKRPGKLELITVLFILAGTVMAGNLFNSAALSFSFKGIVLVICASLTYSVYIVANSKLGKNINWMSKSTLIMLGSASTIFMINAHTIVHSIHFNPEFLMIALFLAVVGTTIPTALFSAGIPKVGSVVSSILMTVELPVAVICAGIVLKEQLDSMQIGGIVVMLMAIAAMNYYRALQNKRGMLN